MNWLWIITFFFLSFFGMSQGQKDDLSYIDDLLLSGIQDRIYPAVAAMAGKRNGKILYGRAFGNFEYLDINPNAPNTTMTSIFDMASITKVLATTTGVALLYQQGYLHLEDKVTDLLQEPSYGKTGGKENVTVLNCLLHNAGYAPDPSPGYYDASYNCPAQMQTEELSCLDTFYSSLLNETLTQPPGEVYVYSDLSMFTLELVIGVLVQQHSLISNSSFRTECYDPNNGDLKSNKGLLYVCSFEAFIRQVGFQNTADSSSSWLSSMTYLLPQSLAAQAVPTKRAGNVSDNNCYALGGICGHAGIFTTILDVGRFAQRYLHLATTKEDETITPYKSWLNATTVKLFTQEYDPKMSSRALGWNINDPMSYDYGWSQSCGNLSSRTFMHIGYTGTCLCIDPVNELWSIVLTNREYAGGSSDAVKGIYRQFHNAMLDLMTVPRQ